MKKDQAIALCRVSSDEQLKNNSLNRQNRAVRKIAEDHNLEIVRTWSGSVSSLRGKNTERKDLKEMIDYCKEHKRVGYLIVDEPDRFMRSIDEAAYFTITFKGIGVKILYSDPALNEDTALASFLRSASFFGAESSNEERQRKSIHGLETAIAEGRYPAKAPLGYKKGIRPGIAEVDPVVGPLLQTQLKRIAAGLATPSRALKDFNKSIERAGIRKAPLKYDKWSSLCVNSYYCGVVEIHKKVDACNPHGMHDALITKKEHEKIVTIIKGRPKNQKGPNAGGNPLYIFDKMLVHADCPMTKTKYNSFVGVTIKNKSGKKYPKYRCRGCYMSFTRDEINDRMSEIAASIRLTESGRLALYDAISEAIELHSGDIEAERTRLYSQRKNASNEADSLMRAFVAAEDGGMKRHLEEQHKNVLGRIKAIDKDLEKLGEIEAESERRFAQFAIGFVNNLACEMLRLSPSEMQECKQLLFPNGFCVDNNRNVYTHCLSPIYRWEGIKNSSSEPENSLMVRVKRL